MKLKHLKDSSPIPSEKFLKNKDYPLKHPKIAFTKKALCWEINLNVAFHNSKSLMLY